MQLLPALEAGGVERGTLEIAEALVATAFGLVAAIPAVVAYNKFTSDLKRMAANMEQFSAEFLNIISRHIKE